MFNHITELVLFRQVEIVLSWFEHEDVYSYNAYTNWEIPI